jgi:uncharacterized protein
MPGKTNLAQLLKTMQPVLNEGEYVFCVMKDVSQMNLNEVLMSFREKEGNTVILKRSVADRLQLSYHFIAAWITLTVHSSLEAVGLTAAFSKALSENGISCNVVAAFYHDHIFVDTKDADKAMNILQALSK